MAPGDDLLWVRAVVGVYFLRKLACAAISRLAPADCRPSSRSSSSTMAKAKGPPERAFGLVRVPDDDLLSHGQSALLSARRRFTVLFGMGRGGASGLKSSGIDGCRRTKDLGPPTRQEEAKLGIRLSCA